MTTAIARSAALARAAVVVSACAAFGACLSHHVELEPIEIKPIHITLDVNLKVQRELDQFFDFEEPADAATNLKPGAARAGKE